MTFRKYIKEYERFRRKESDVSFLKECVKNKIVPKFVYSSFKCEDLTDSDVKKIQMKILSKKLRKEVLCLAVCQKALTSIRYELFELLDSFSFWLCIKICIRYSRFNISKKIESQRAKLVKLKRLFGIVDFSVDKTFLNFSNCTLNNDESNLLKFGPNHGVRSKFNNINFKCKIEEFYQSFVSRNININLDKHKWINVTNSYINKNKMQSNSDSKTLSNLKKKNIAICRFDKGNGLVILDKDDYIRKTYTVINNDKFSKVKVRLNGIPFPIKDDDFLHKCLKNLKSKKYISEDVLKKLWTKGSQPAKLYGLPKVHKIDTPMRPVLSMINTAQYKVAKYLDSILKPLISNHFECKDSFEFVEFITSQNVLSSNEVMVSFDIVSLFTNIPLDETIDLCVNMWDKDNLEFSPIALKELLTFSTKNVKFLFDNEWYVQNDGVAMGSPLAPTLASIFLMNFEKAFSNNSNFMPRIYKRYVDDTFMVFENSDHIDQFLDFVNSLHPNIKFTYEKEINNRLSFLDVLIHKTSSKFQTSTFKKATDTGLYTTPMSFCDPKYKRNLLYNLINRTWRIASDFQSAIKDINNLAIALQKNGFSDNIISQAINRTITKFYDKKTQSNIDANVYDCTTLIVPYSEGAKTFKKDILNLLPSDPNTRIIFKTSKTLDFFSNKSPTPFDIQSNLVYKFTCHRCNASYIGETSRHLRTRITDHSLGVGTRSIKNHEISCTERTFKTNKNEFKIIGKNFNNYKQRVISEGLLITLHNPDLNVQYNSDAHLKLFN